MRLRWLGTCSPRSCVVAVAGVCPCRQVVTRDNGPFCQRKQRRHSCAVPCDDADSLNFTVAVMEHHPPVIHIHRDRCRARALHRHNSALDKRRSRALHRHRWVPHVLLTTLCGLPRCYQCWDHCKQRRPHPVIRCAASCLWGALGAGRGLTLDRHLRQPGSLH